MGLVLRDATPEAEEAEPEPEEEELPDPTTMTHEELLAEAQRARQAKQAERDAKVRPELTLKRYRN